MWIVCYELWFMHNINDVVITNNRYYIGYRSITYAAMPIGNMHL